jgi:hypothetical protein
MPSSHSPDSLMVAFDDTHAVANAGLLLPATLAERLGSRQSSISWLTLATVLVPTGRDASC